MNHHPSWLGFSRSAISQACHAVAVVAVVASAPALAQNTTSSITGRIVGADGKPVAGATVVIVHVESGSILWQKVETSYLLIPWTEHPVVFVMCTSGKA